MWKCLALRTPGMALAAQHLLGDFGDQRDRALLLHRLRQDALGELVLLADDAADGARDSPSVPLRFITTVPTASMPSRLERLDSKYIARIMHSRSLIMNPPPPNEEQPETPSRAAEGGGKEQDFGRSEHRRLREVIPGGSRGAVKIGF